MRANISNRSKSLHNISSRQGLNRSAQNFLRSSYDRLTSCLSKAIGSFTIRPPIRITVSSENITKNANIYPNQKDVYLKST
jgi:hypothetical protein